MKLNIVPARTGFLWVKLGIQTFFKQPLALSGLFFIYMAAASILSLVPGAGVVLALAIVPAATLGLMAATQEATKGRFPMPTVLVSAFRAGKQRLRAMLMLGMLYALACVAVMFITPLLVDVPPPAPGAARETTMMSPQFQMMMLVASLFYLPVSLIFWHAPALVHWHGVPPAKSLFFSIVACLRNAGAFLMYGIGWLGVFFAASLLIGLLATLTGSPQFAAAAMMPVALLLASMFMTSIYFTFRDSFVTEEPQPPQDLPSATANAPPPGEPPT